jgi:hypothetical protein
LGRAPILPSTTRISPTPQADQTQHGTHKYENFAASRIGSLTEACYNRERLLQPALRTVPSRGQVAADHAAVQRAELEREQPPQMGNDTCRGETLLLASEERCVAGMHVRAEVSRREAKLERGMIEDKPCVPPHPAWQRRPGAASLCGAPLAVRTRACGVRR